MTLEEKQRLLQGIGWNGAKFELNHGYYVGTTRPVDRLAVPGLNFQDPLSTVLWVKLGSKGSSRVPCEKNATVKEGKMQLRGTGVSETECEIQFSQEAQAINLRQACLPSGVSSVTMKYCSDQDAFLLQAMVAGMSTDVFLAKGTCSAETSLAQSIIRRDRDRPVQHHRFDSPP